MIPRGTIIAALLAIELAICGEAAVAIHSGRPDSWTEPRIDAHAALGPFLIEGGPHKRFDVGTHPALTVDIGYADLTIVANDTAQVDVSVSPSTAFGIFRETAPITATGDGTSVRIATTSRGGLSIGDDRMVTIAVPSQTQVTVLKAGDIKASGLRAKASFHSVGRGSVTVEDYDAPALVASSQGRVSLWRVAATHIEATSSDSRVEGTALQVRDGTVDGSSRVTLGFAAGTDALVTADTDDGTIRLAGFSATARAAKAQSSSSSSDDDDAASQTVRVGAGDGRLDVHAGDGNISLTQEAAANL